MVSKLKDKAIEMFKKTCATCKRALSYMVELTLMVTLIATLVGGLLYAAVRAPEIHGQWLRHSVGSKVYTIRDNARSGGGTGFAIQAPSGATYILTNDHVCAVSKDKQTVLVQNDEGLSMRRRIIERSDFSDLCLIEGIPSVKGLKLGSAPAIGQIVAAIGHPALMPITLSRGEIITHDDVSIIEGPISVTGPGGESELAPPERGGITSEQCSKPKNRQVDQDVMFFGIKLKFKICMTVTKNAFKTNMVIQPGSSGSPVVDFWGNVVGAVFAGDRAMWGISVSQEDIAQFLKNY